MTNNMIAKLSGYQNKMNINNNIAKPTNEIDNVDINGNYLYDPLYIYQPVRRSGNKIYFYAEVDHYSQLVLMQLLNDVQSDIISKRAMDIINGTCDDYIELHICSYGGLLSAGFAIYDFIKKMPINVVGIVDGVAMSAASLILLACTVREMSDNSTVLLHQLSCDGLGGTYNQLKDNSINLELAMKKLRAIYLKETYIGVTDEQLNTVKDILSDETISEDDAYDKASKFVQSIQEDRLVALNELLSHDLELSKEQCAKFGIIQDESENDDLNLTEEDNQKISDFINDLLKSKKNKSKAKKSTMTTKTGTRKTKQQKKEKETTKTSK